MKNLKAIVMGFLFTSLCASAGAQDKKIPLNEPDRSKPRLFSDLPQKMTLDLKIVQPLLAYQMGSAVNLQLTDHFLFQGQVVSRSGSSSDSVISVVVRSSNRPGSTLTLTRIIDPKGNIQFHGRIISPANGDAFEITGEKGQYMLEKKNLYDLMSE
ncbi:MAG: hypothetical protein ACJ75B_10605 [Flavisolibacter sp.]